RSPLFQTTFALQRPSESISELGQLHLSELDIEQTTIKFELMITMLETAQGLSCGIGYRTDLFEAETIRCMLEHWQVLLQGIVRSPQSRISELPLLSNAERQRLLVEWNATRLSLPVEPCLHTFLARQAVCTTDALP